MSGIIDGKEVLIVNEKYLIKESVFYDANHIQEIASLGNSVSFLMVDAELVGFVAQGDTIKEASYELVKELKAMGIEPVMMTGDNEFYLGGAGVALDFVKIPDAADERSYSHMNARSFSQLNFLSVEEGHFEDDNWVCDFRRNGDESNFSQYVLAGEVIRIRLNPKTLE